MPMRVSPKADDAVCPICRVRMEVMALIVKERFKDDRRRVRVSLTNESIQLVQALATDVVRLSKRSEAKSLSGCIRRSTRYWPGSRTNDRERDVRRAGTGGTKAPSKATA